MANVDKETASRKQKIYREVVEYWINFIYMGVFFGMFTTYRRLILAEYQITYLHYGIGLIEAAVLAKVIMLGDIIRLGRGLEEKPLIFPTLYKSVVFSVWVAVFGVLEHMVEGLLGGKGLAGGFNELIATGRDELVARCLVTFLAFIPFFAFRELGRVLGEGKIREMFFRRRVAAEFTPPICKSG